MLDRLLGLETEYAIRWSAHDPSAERPSNRLIFDAIVEALGQRLATSSGARKLSRRQRFIQNGGSVCYEYLPKAADGGLVEAGTPECRGPSQALLYQRAQDRMLYEALEAAEAILSREGHFGSLGLLKNCRDVEGNVYGAQENYEVELARGAGLWLYRFGLALVVPLAVVPALVYLAAIALVLVVFIAVLLVVFLVLVIVHLVGLVFRADGLDPDFPELDPVVHGIERVFEVLIKALTLPAAAAYSGLIRAFGFRRIRKHAMAFLISRPVLTGTGTLDPNSGAFGLSEKGPAIRARVRTSIAPSDRAIFDIGNLHKPLFCLMELRVRPLASLFRRRQRLQLGLSDSNCAQQAEYLKLATTSLVLDMAEAGALDELPRVQRPIDALHCLIGDPELEAKVACSDGVERSAVELQRLYLDAARAFVGQSAAPSLEAREIVKIWAETLDILETEPARAFGRLDWVTKRGLLASAGAELELDARKKIDLKYAEIGVGYFARLEADGLAPMLVSADEIEAAILDPPSDTPARRRSQLIREFASEGTAATVDWDRIEIKRGFLRREVIYLDDFRR